MRILLVGAGGVGAAFAAIAARRDFFEAVVVADYDLSPGRAGRARSTRGSRAAQVDASDGRLGRGPGPRARDHARDERRRPAVRDADLRRRARRRRRLPRHGDVAVAAAPRAAVRRDRGEARRRAVRAGRPSGRRRAGSRCVGIGVEPGLSDVFARYAADHLFSEIDELGVRDGANLDRRGLRLRAVVLASGRRSRSASTRRWSGRRTAAGSPPSRSASRRCSTSPRASGRSSA